MLTFNRKLLLTLTSIIAITIMPACKHDSKEINELLKIEKLNESDPKAALELIDSIQPEKYNTPKLKALYSLVKSQALDKNLILLNSDSIISIARQYYEDSPDKYHRMKSEYYYGMINLNSEKLDTALLAFLKAYDLGEEIKDYFWQGMAASRIAEIFNISANAQEEVEFAKIAVNCFNKIGKEDYLDYSMLDLSYAYHNANYPDSCIMIATDLLKRVKKTRNTSLEYDCKDIIGTAYISKKDYFKAIEIFESNHHPDSTITECNIFLGLAYISVGNITKGKEILMKYKAEDMPLHYIIYQIYYKLGDKDKAITALEKLYNKCDENFNKRISSHLLMVLFKYHNTEKYLDKLKISEYKTKTVLISIISLVLILLLVFIFLYHRQKQITKIIEMSQSANSLNNRLNYFINSQNKLSNSIHSLLSSQFILINNACQTIFESDNEQKARKHIAQTMINLIDAISDDENMINELKKLINYHCDNLYDDFRSDFPDLKEDDYRLFLYSALGFDNVAISRFFNTSIKGIYGRRDRIKKRILSSQIINIDKYIAILYPNGLKNKNNNGIGTNQNLYRPNFSR